MHYVICKKENSLYVREHRGSAVEEYKYSRLGYLNAQQGILEQYLQEKDSLVWCKRCEEITKKKCYLK